ncbi:MAG: 50S ribosomal protein L15 [Desulfobacterales bacterium]|nr:50S ribosomal protein L15 [Desulfobacterales bacterium]MBF0396463.1 50S ribosomal protein L15 [Desulfobacterales bacterium]
MQLNNLSPSEGSKKSIKRVGRGVGSGLGKTAGRGSKGQRARSGGRVRPGFEGGQMPIHRRLPKRGFTNIFKEKFVLINIRDLSAFEASTIIDKEKLLSAGVIKNKTDSIKLLGQGEITYPLILKVNKASKGATQKIEAAGGKVEII